jgi:hypothetical protein
MHAKFFKVVALLVGAGLLSGCFVEQPGYRYCNGYGYGDGYGQHHRHHHDRY